MHHGNIPRMLDTIAMLPPEQRAEYPARQTLYAYEKKHQWKERYKRMQSAVIAKLESGVALHYDRINQIANLAATGLAKRLVEALQTADAEKQRVFTGDLLKIVWEMQRTERGLPTHITKMTQTNVMSSPAENRLRARGLGKIADTLKQMPQQQLLQIINMLGGDVVETPAILR